MTTLLTSLDSNGHFRQALNDGIVADNTTCFFYST